MFITAAIWRIVKLAIDEDIIAMKYPPHCKKILQSLDVCYVGPLKKHWQTLCERMNVFGNKSTLDKGEFINLLCSIWNKGMNFLNVIKFFSYTGAWLLDPTKYPLHKFDPQFLKKYNEWKEPGAT